MCGIAGSVSAKSNQNSYSLLRSALTKLKHRGPDGSGQIENLLDSHRVNLGNVRLAIIDLTSGGSQPMSSSDGIFHLVFNGEIYNYKELKHELLKLGSIFRTNSDTEVLLKAWEIWGEKCLLKLKGMFSFAILDSQSNRLTCIRDSFGMKPLYYIIGDRHFAFASEIGALKQLSVEQINIDNWVTSNYLIRGQHDLRDKTFFENIFSLEPGNLIRLDLSTNMIKSNIERWWSPLRTTNHLLTKNDAAEELKRLFLENIRLHLRSDVALGVSLSGGIDSSSIACAVRYLEPDLPIHTFSFLSTDVSKNENRWVNSVNKHIGAKTHPITINQNDLLKDLDNFISAQGEPFGGTSIYAQYKVYQSAHENGIKVILDGQGADELFAGYFGYPEWKIRSQIHRKEFSQLIYFIRNWHLNYPDQRMNLLGRLIAPNLPRMLKILKDKISNREALKLVNNPKRNHAPDLTYYDGFDLNSWESSLSNILKHKVFNGDLSRLLRFADRNSMAWSIECRLPFLSNDLFEFANSLPEEYLVSNSAVTKDVLRKALVGLVPSDVLNRKDKIGYETPEIEWLRPLKNIDNLLDGLELLPWINLDLSKKYFKKIIESNGNSDLAWRILNLSRWAILNSK
jgi:asparagine synthase (glutamine-hydrolysing)